MKIKLAFLGTGTCNSAPRNPSSLAISNGDEVIFIDFGGGAYHQISRLKDPFFNYKNITTIILTHFHIDHISGLPDFFWGEIWDSSGRRVNPLNIVGPHGIRNFYQYRLLPFLGDFPIPFEVNITRLSNGDAYNGSFYRATACNLAHGDSSTGYLIEMGNTKLAVTGDTGYCEDLISLLHLADIAVMEWGISDHQDYPGHISTDDISQILKTGAVPEKVYINHMYPLKDLDFNEQVKKNKKILKGYSDRFFFPEDLEIIDLN